MAKGGFSAVYRGTAQQKDAPAKDVVVKVGRPKDSFDHEFGLLGQVGQDANVVNALLHGKLDDGRPFLVMDRIDGETLAERFSRGKLSIPETRKLVADVCDGLAALHRERIAMLDLKPENVLWNEAANAYQLIDLGIAHQGRSTEHNGIWTMSSASPEHLGRLPVGPRSDLFSLGLLIHQALTGEPTFHGSLFNVRQARIAANRSRVPLTPIHPEVDEVLRKAVSIRSGPRQKDVETFRTEMNAALDAMESPPFDSVADVPGPQLKPGR